jgi:DUF1016 N-terminal domain
MKTMRTKLLTRVRTSALLVAPDTKQIAALVRDLGVLIEQARQEVAVAANATLYWQIGSIVRTHLLEGRRAEYGGGIVAAMGRQLETSYGRGFGEKSLRRMVQFSCVFPDFEIVAALQRQLGRSHFKLIIPLR